MKIFVCLLRGINVGGKNLISMKELKEVFVKIGYKNVESIGNTGVILFTSESDVITEKIKIELNENFEIDLKIVILEYKEIENLVNNLPFWWNENKKYYNAVIFLLDDCNINDIISDLNPIDEEVDKVEIINNTIFWTSIHNDSKLYSKSLYARLSKSKGYPYVSLRNGNTFNKIYEKMTIIKEKSR